MVYPNNPETGPFFGDGFGSPVEKTATGQEVTTDLTEPEARKPLFEPEEPRTFAALGLTPTFVEQLLLKALLEQPGRSGREIAASIAVNPGLVLPILKSLKGKLLVVHATAPAIGGDFHFALSEAGRRMAADVRNHHPYSGPAPVTYESYLDSVRRQSITHERVGPGDLLRAFSDLIVDRRLLDLLGPAMASGRGLFLFGNSGNGKSSLATRMAAAYRHLVYIPRAVLMEGQVVQVFDPQVHVAVEQEVDDFASYRPDPRWVLCRRPTVIAGGELTMDSLELYRDPVSGVCEAPLQMKANCGLMVVDDFGRQRMDPSVLLNRWIIPLEERVDYIRLASGRKVKIPFDPFLVFSTNLDPSSLVDEAFLRRIPYKVQVSDPTKEVMTELLMKEASDLGFVDDPGAIRFLVRSVYTDAKREMRFCHARDLLFQVKSRCEYLGEPLRVTKEGIALAAKGYFTLL